MFRVVYSDKVATEDVPALSKSIALRIRRVIEEKLNSDPLRFGKPLQHEWRGYRSLRVGDYRVIYRVSEQTVHVVAIGHRREIYDPS